MLRLLALTAPYLAPFLALLLALPVQATEASRASPSGCGGAEVAAEAEVAPPAVETDPAEKPQLKKAAGKSGVVSPLGSAPTPAEPRARLRWSSFLPGMFK